MTTEVFKAGVQYGDWKGSSAADNADAIDASSWLEENDHMNVGEFLLGIEMFVGENRNERFQEPVHVRFVIVDKGDFDTVKEMVDDARANSLPVKVRVVDIEMLIADFMRLFKRFSITLSPDKILEGLDIVTLP